MVEITITTGDNKDVRFTNLKTTIDKIGENGPEP